MSWTDAHKEDRDLQSSPQVTLRRRSIWTWLAVHLGSSLHVGMPMTVRRDSGSGSNGNSFNVPVAGTLNGTHNLCERC